MKELKDFGLMVFGRKDKLAWNPVKELKGRKVAKRVMFADHLMWNPVKELKGSHQQGLPSYPPNCGIR